MEEGREGRGVWGVGNVHTTTLTVQCHLRPLTFGGGCLVGVPGGKMLGYFHLFTLTFAGFLSGQLWFVDMFSVFHLCWVIVHS